MGRLDDLRQDMTNKLSAHFQHVFPSLHPSKQPQ
jgi:hypothetical protein